MGNEVTATSWNTRHFDPLAYQSPGNHACLWDIATERLASYGHQEITPTQIQSKVNEIVAFHNQQSERPGFRRIDNPDVIGDGQVIFVPPDGKAVPAGTRLQVGQKVASPDGKTVLSIESGKNEKGEPSGKLYVYRDDGQGWHRVGDFHLGAGVTSLEVTDDGKLHMVDNKGVHLYYGNGGGKDSRLVVQNDGNVVIYGGDGRVLWATGNDRPR